MLDVPTASTTRSMPLVARIAPCARIGAAAVAGAAGSFAAAADLSSRGAT